MKGACTPGELARRLGALPVAVDGLEARVCDVPLEDYGGGPRPSSVVRLWGQGHRGLGENVAFTAEEHEHFAARCRALSDAVSRQRRGASSVDEIVAAWAVPPKGAADGESARSASALYQRAALEAALIDLAMRQADLSLARLTGVAEAPLRVVISFAASADPVAVVRAHRASGYQGEFKVDVDPSWDESTREALARQGAVAILDFKGRGQPDGAVALARLFPGSIFEDPPAGQVAALVSRDAPLTDARAVAAALAAGEAVNLKAPRMGGPLELLRGLDLALRAHDGGGRHGGGGRDRDDRSARTTAYFGGMFEVGVGRAQARQLAALYCGEAPNDLALNSSASPAQSADAASDALPALSAAPESVTIRLDSPGFGATG